MNIYRHTLASENMKTLVVKVDLVFHIENKLAKKFCFSGSFSGSQSNAEESHKRHLIGNNENVISRTRKMYDTC